MYEAIEAISRNGGITPLEPVQFEENEHLVILRLSKRLEQDKESLIVKDWRDFVGVLEGSPHFSGDPLHYQRVMRNEWD